MKVRHYYWIRQAGPWQAAALPTCTALARSLTRGMPRHSIQPPRRTRAHSGPVAPLGVVHWVGYAAQEEKFTQRPEDGILVEGLFMEGAR